MDVETCEWSPGEVEEALCEAVETLRLIGTYDRYLGCRSFHGIEPILSDADLFALGVSRAEILEGPDIPKIILHAQQQAIDRYLDVLDWLRFLPMDFRELRKLVSLAVEEQGALPKRIRWSRIDFHFSGNPGRKVLWRRYGDALKLITKRLNEKPTPVHRSIYSILAETYA